MLHTMRDFKVLLFKSCVFVLLCVSIQSVLPNLCRVQSRQMKLLSFFLNITHFAQCPLFCSLSCFSSFLQPLSRERHLPSSEPKQFLKKLDLDIFEKFMILNLLLMSSELKVWKRALDLEYLWASRSF